MQNEHKRKCNELRACNSYRRPIELKRKRKQKRNYHHFAALYLFHHFAAESGNGDGIAGNDETNRMTP